MKKKYDEIMDQIELTKEMRNRILDNLQKFDMGNGKSHKVVQISSIRRYVSVAACLAILLVASFALPKLLNRDQPSVEYVGNYGIVEVSSLEKLEAAVHFDMPEVEALPFTPKEKTYMAYGSDLAEIQYEDENQTACFRKSVGTEDNSGDYNEYSNNQKITVKNAEVTLKGNNSAFTLAIWSDGDFSYSLNLSVGLSPAEWKSMIVSIME